MTFYILCYIVKMSKAFDISVRHMILGGLFMGTKFALALFAIVLVISVGVIIAMFVSLAKQGDERRKTIIEKTSTKTFAVVVMYLLFCIIENIYNVVSKTDLSPEGMNPFITLTVISIIYAIALAYHKKKYGD